MKSDYQHSVVRHALVQPAIGFCEAFLPRSAWRFLLTLRLAASQAMVTALALVPYPELAGNKKWNKHWIKVDKEWNKSETKSGIKLARCSCTASSLLTVWLWSDLCPMPRSLAQLAPLGTVGTPFLGPAPFTGSVHRKMNLQLIETATRIRERESSRHVSSIACHIKIH